MQNIQTNQILTPEQKAQKIADFTRRGMALDKQIRDEYITLDGIDKQRSSRNFVLSENAGDCFAEKYDLVPGTDLYGIIEQLQKVEFENMTERQKQMVMLILFYGIFNGVYESCFYRSNLDSRQCVALLDLMAQDVDSLKTNIVPILHGLEKIDADEKLKEKDSDGKLKKTEFDEKLVQRFHNRFDVYNPQKWGPRESRYDVVHAAKCAEWSKEPDKNKDKILAHKDYMLLSLVPEHLPALFSLMHSGVESSLNSKQVNNYFVNFRSVSDINVLIGYLRGCNGGGDAYVLPSAKLWIQNMRNGMQQSYVATEANIFELTIEQTGWEKTIDKIYNQLPVNKVAPENSK